MLLNVADELIELPELEKAVKNGDEVIISGMPAQWTGEVIGKMHQYSVTGLMLSKALDWHPKYLSAVLNGHRTPKDAEQKIRVALNSLIVEQKSNTQRLE